jgi:hypothetical protein
MGAPSSLYILAEGARTRSLWYRCNVHSSRYAVCPRCRVLCAAHTEEARKTSLRNPGLSMPCADSPAQSLAAALALRATAENRP